MWLQQKSNDAYALQKDVSLLYWTRKTNADGKVHQPNRNSKKKHIHTLVVFVTLEFSLGARREVASPKKNTLPFLNLFDFPSSCSSAVCYLIQWKIMHPQGTEWLWLIFFYFAADWYIQWIGANTQINFQKTNIIYKSTQRRLAEACYSAQHALVTLENLCIRYIISRAHADYYSSHKFSFRFLINGI